MVRRPIEQVLLVAAVVVGLALGVALGVVGSFLVPFRVAGTIAPVSIAIAVLGNLAASLLVGHAAGSRVVGALPGLAWLAVVLVFSSPRAQGDIVVTGGAVGALFLVTGAVAALVPIALRKH